MMQMIVERGLYSIILLMGFGLFVYTYLYLTRRRASSAARMSGMLSRELGLGTPMLLYFWSVGCAQCRPQEQQVELARSVLQREGKVLAIRKVNALEEPEFAKSMGVMTVPTTILVGPHGMVSAWNPGWTTAKKLLAQYNNMAPQNYTAK